MYPLIKLSDLQDEHILTTGIYKDYLHNHYITVDWSPEMYDALAFAGFISVSIRDEAGTAYLFPELQYAYAVLHWHNLHIARRLRDFISKQVLDRDYSISVNRNIDGVFDGIKRHHADRNWLTKPYMDVLLTLRARKQYRSHPVSIELWHEETLIGGEIGYTTGRVYTSLTGFFDRECYSNFGKVQLLSLALLLQRSGYEFWNMGHPYMDYKFALGAVEYERTDFLKLWMKHRGRKNELEISEEIFGCNELLRGIVAKR